MSEWKKVKLGEVAKMMRGKAVTRSSIVPGKIPVMLGGREPAYYCNESNHTGPCFIVSRSGASAGYVSYWNEPIFVTDGFLFEADSKIDTQFLYYSLKARQQSLIMSQNGTGIPHVRSEDLKNIELAFPNESTRIRIAAILSDYDAAIANCRKQIALLEEAAQRLYCEWFADGKGEKMPLRDFIYFQEGPGIRNWQYVDADGVRFINIRCISNGDVDVSGASMISKEEAFGKYNHFQLREDDIVMSCSGTLGRSAVIRQDHLPLCLNTSVIRFRPKLDARDYSYVYCYLNSDDFLNAQKSMANGAAQLNFGPKHLNLIELTLPQEEMRYKFNEVVMPVLKEKKILYSQIRALTEARDRLLPKLMSGEVAV